MLQELTTNVCTIHHNIDDSEVFLQPMTNEHDTSVYEVEKLQVASFESGKVFRAH